jgi:hypothetical protein
VCYSFPSLPFDESTAFTPPAAFGPYRVLHQIGSGVFGPVFRTYDPQQDRLVAVKAFRLEVVPETVAKLAGNLRKLSASGLAHPAVVQVLDAGLEGMSAYLAMEYVSAETLDVALRHLAPAPLDRALPILTELAKAIEATWAAGIGFGAIHPRDVFILSGTNEVRLTGCGVVPALEAAGIKVPPRRPYSAPERGTAESWDIRADIYSLGVLAHELLTKRRPAGPNEQDGSLVTGTSPEARVLIRRVLAAALAERPDQRFATPTAFVDALTAISRGEPVGPLPEGANAADERPALPPVRKSEPPPLLAMAEAADPVVEPAPVPPVVVVTPDPGPAASAPVAPEPTVVLPSPPRRAPVPAVSRPLGLGDRPMPTERVERPLPPPRPSPPPLRVSPPPVIVPMRAPFPWAAVVAAFVAGGAVTGVAGYRVGLRSRPVAVTAASTSSAKPTDTDVAVQVPAPLIPGGSTPAGATAPPPPSAPQAEPATPAADGKAADGAGRAAGHPATTGHAKTDPLAGSLLVETRPEGARVVLDGKPLGLTPLTLPDVHTGAHPLRLERTGYKTLVTHVTIKSGEQARVAVTLELLGVLQSWLPLSR